LRHARYVIGLCDRWKKLPSEVLAEPAEMWRLLKIVELGGAAGEEVS
jgi:hypothetical protein